ncbi:MAG: esterase-like activity of phytase family protein, partial [Candidatus Binatia bacterium]
YHLRVYTIEPRFKTQNGGNGRISVKRFIELHDPDQHIPFALTNHFTAQRILTGADFDIESIQRTPDGTLWFGDEFGPFLLHTDAQGRVLEPPIALPDFDNPGQEIRSPQNPFNEESSAVRAGRRRVNYREPAVRAGGYSELRFPHAAAGARKLPRHPHGLFVR